MTDPTTQIDGQILSMRRLFDDPPATVFAAFTEPDQLDLWWGPDGYTTTTHTLDLRRGGVWHYCLRMPGAPRSCVKSWYQEVIPPERLVYRDTFVDGDGRQIAGSPEFLVTVAFRAVGDGTEVTMRSEFATPDQLQEIVAMGMVEGMTQSFARLDAVLLSRRTI